MCGDDSGRGPGRGADAAAPADADAEVEPRSPRTAAIGVLASAVLVAGLLGAALLVGPATAGDAVAIYQPEPQSETAEPGETVQVDVTINSDGSVDGSGLDRTSFVVAVHPDVASIEDVEAGPYLAGDGGEVEQSVTHVVDGVVRVEQERVGADDGQVGYDVTATLTLAIREDAPAADATVEVVTARTLVAGSEMPIQSFGREGTVAVDGGGEALAPTYEAEGGNDDGDGGVAVTTAGESEESETDGDAASTDDSVPGFGFFAALLAIGGGLAARTTRD